MAFDKKIELHIRGFDGNGPFEKAREGFPWICQNLG